MARVRETNDWLLPEELSSGAGPILVLFFDSGRPESRPTARAFAEVAREHSGAFRFLSCDLEENPSVRRDRALDALPAIVLFAEGVEVLRREGAQGRKSISKMLVGKQRKP